MKKIWKRSGLLAATGMMVFLAAGTPSGVRAEQPEQEITVQGETLTKEQADQILSYIIEQISSGALSSEEAVRAAIAEGEEKFQVTLTEADKENIVEIVNTINSWNFDTEELAEKAKELYDEYGVELLEQPEEALKDAAKAEVDGFFQGIGNFFVGVGNSIADFFKNGFEKLSSLF